MTTKQFFEMELPLSLTPSEMYSLLDALYIAEEENMKNNLECIAKNCRILRLKIREKTKEYNKYYETYK